MNISLREGRENRELARERGEKTYLNRDCKVCGSNERYTNSSACVPCSRTRGNNRYETMNYNQVQWRANRRQAKHQGLVTYHGKACVTCSNTLRYTCNKACLTCHAKQNKKQRQKVARNPEDRNLWAKSDRVRAMLSSAKHRAKTRQLDFSITKDNIIIPDMCPVLGVELTWEGNKATSPSLDRLDNSKGYTPENTRVISTRANSLKSNATLEELKALVAWIERESNTHERFPLQSAA